MSYLGERWGAKKNPAYWRGFVTFTLIVFLLCRFDGVMAAVVEAINRPAIVSSLGSHSVLLDVAYAGKNLVAVGERGTILISADGGDAWRQIASPVSVTLTGVRFIDDSKGYIIGHGGSVLSTENGGEDWTLQLDGSLLADDLLAQAVKNNDPQAIRRAHLLVADGPDKPFLDILLLGAKHLIVVGAYGFVFESKDGGQTWNSWMDRIDNPFGLHLYSIRKQGNRILIAGEQGFVALSMDDGQSFETIETPYEGSFFTAQLLGDSDIVLAGLRGNSFISHNDGGDWKKIDNPVAASITASLIRSNGQILMVNKAGMVLSLNGNQFIPMTYRPLSPLSNILEKSDGGMLVLSIHGAVSIEVGNLP